MRESTGKLLEQLKNKNISLQDYLDKNADSFIALDIKEFWDALIMKSCKSKADIINKADVSYTYFYDIISGRKIPTFDVIVKIALAIHLSLDDTNEALLYAGKRALSPRYRRDAAIIKSIIGKSTIRECNALLNEVGEVPLK